jgi:hypothetical protein
MIYQYTLEIYLTYIIQNALKNSTASIPTKFFDIGNRNGNIVYTYSKVKDQQSLDKN